MTQAEPHVFSAENIHVVCISPFSYGSFAGRAGLIDGPRGIFTPPTPHSLNIISYRRQTFSPELEWRDSVRFFSIDLPVIAICCRGLAYKCVNCDLLLTVYPDLVCTLQVHIEFEGSIAGVRNIVEIIKYLREASSPCPSDSDWIRCQFNSGIVDFPNFHSLAKFIREKFKTAYYLSSNLPAAVSFVFPIFYCGLVHGCKTADELIARHRTDIAGILNLWPNNYDLQSQAEVESSTRVNFHPMVYGASYISSAGFFEFHPENVTEIVKRDGTSLSEHHFREIYYAAAICEIAVAKYFALRVCDDILDKKFSSTRISFVYVLNPFLSLFRALDVLQFERHITMLLSHIRSLGLTRKPYTREILTSLDEQFDTVTLQDRVTQKVVGINRILTSTFQSVIATTTLIVAMVAIFLTVLQIVGFGGDKPPAGQTAPAAVHQTASPHPQGR